MATYNNDNEYSSKGVGTAGLTLGIIGTSLASGILNGTGIGGILGNNQNPASSTVYQLAQKDNEITMLKGERYTDSQVRELTGEVCGLKQRVTAIEVAEPLREQILQERINCVANTVNRLVQPMIPNANIAPGWGPAFVSPFPPPPPPAPSTQVSGGTTATTTTNG